LANMSHEIRCVCFLIFGFMHHDCWLFSHCVL
jgi:hypothetical protein